MIVKINNDEIVKVDHIIREETYIRGYIHGKKSIIFEYSFLIDSRAKEAMVAITEVLRTSQFVDINLIYHQFK
jgi:hypothetical protein